MLKLVIALDMPHLAVRDEFHPKRNQARQKLATLPKNRFKDLSSDVFYELERRFPQLREEFRSDSAQSEGRADGQSHNRSGSVFDRQNTLGSSTTGEDESTEDRPMMAAKSQSSRTITADASSSAAAASMTGVVVPQKSTLVEEQIAVPYATEDSNKWDSSIDDSTRRNRDSIDDSIEIDPNRNTIYSQASSVGTGFFNGYAQSRATESVASPHVGGGESASAFGIEKLRSDYEFRIATLQQKLTALEAKTAEMEREKESAMTEVERKLKDQRDAHEMQTRSLEIEAEQVRGKHKEVQLELSQTASRLERLQHEHQKLSQEHEEYHKQAQTRGNNDTEMQEEYESLQREYSEQEEVVTELRSEVTNLMEELRQLSLRHDEILSDKENEQTIIRDLNNQVSSYKRKYENAKTELRNLKATSQLYVQAPKADDFMPASEEGVIADVSLTAFQSSIDDLIAVARSKTPSHVLLAMKTVVLATTLITDDVAKYEQRGSISGEIKEQLPGLKSKVSNNLNNLMTASRNHASSHGLSPVSLMDAAASHVSTSIVDLVKLFKVRKATKAEAEEFEATFTQNGTLPNGLKPLHTNVLNSSTINNAAFSPRGTSRIEGGKSGDDSHDQFLGPNTASTTTASSSSAVENRFSPRLRQTPTMGRYSPVGYRSDVVRKTSNGTGSWKVNGDDRTRNASISSTTSAGPVTMDAPVSAMPSRLPLLASPRTPQLASHDHDDAKYEREARTRSVLATLRASMAPSLNSMRGEEATEENWAELRNYIEVQTEAIVHSIQALLSSIREGAEGKQLNENLTQITTIVSSIIAISKDNIPKSSSVAQGVDGEKILSDLSDNCEKLIDMQMVGTFDKLTKSNMASASYGVAKGLKALSGLLNAEDR